MADNEQKNALTNGQKQSDRKSEREARSGRALRENLKKRRQQVRDRQNPKEEK